MSTSIYMPEMTNLQVREYLEAGAGTVIVPVGSTEDHGDHGPLWTDVYIPLEVAKRAAPELQALTDEPEPVRAPDPSPTLRPPRSRAAPPPRATPQTAPPNRQARRRLASAQRRA